MQTFIRTIALQKRIAYLKSKGKTIGFSPTMGALHDGHLSLIKESQRQCDVSVCSIFVNPTQFNVASDLKKYPRTMQSDKVLLRDVNLDILFIPGMHEVYLRGMNTRVEIDLKGLDTRLEGAFRPGHFAGVVQVVKRLLDMVRPDKLFMGQKDFQQFSIIGHMICSLNLTVELVVVPIHREADGLAMSSRNVRLTSGFRKKALILNRMLQFAKKNLGKLPVEAIKKHSIMQIEKYGLKPEYFELVDGNTLLPVRKMSDSNYVVALVAAWAGDVRLIDNEILFNRDS